jgi:predicted butyrate kinase (DUF1464 family)
MKKSYKFFNYLINLLITNVVKIILSYTPAVSLYLCMVRARHCRAPTVFTEIRRVFITFCSIGQDRQSLLFSLGKALCQYRKNFSALDIT